MALSKAKRIEARDGLQRVFGVKAGVTIFKGALVVLDVDDNAVPGRSGAAADADLVCVGYCEETVTGTATDGEAKVKTRKGTILLKNSQADPVPLSRIGFPALIVDDETVARTSGASTRPQAGTIFDVDAAGVWVSV